jgi:hypothetical protein
MALKDEYEIGFLRIITGYHNGFFRVAAACFRIQFQCDRSLAPGRDCPVKVGNGTASTGEHLLYIEDGFAGIPDIEFVYEFSVLAKFSKIVSCFGYFNSRSLLGGGCRLIGQLSGIRRGVEHTDLSLAILLRRLYNMQKRKCTPEKTCHSRHMCTAGKRQHCES